MKPVNEVQGFISRTEEGRQTGGQKNLFWNGVFKLSLRDTVSKKLTMATVQIKLRVASSTEKNNVRIITSSYTNDRGGINNRSCHRAIDRSIDHKKKINRRQRTKQLQ
jgi:hypothetical protein